MSTNNKFASRRSLAGVDSSAFGAVIILIVGVVLLLDQMDLVAIHDLFRFWPMAIIGLGLFQIVMPGQTLQKAFGGLVILFGMFYLARNLDLIHIRGSIFWPMVIISVGVLLLVRAIESQHTPATGELNPGMQKEVCIFSGCKKKNDSQQFLGADLFTMFGGIDIDLSGAKMAGSSAEIRLTATFGGIELRIPQDWVVVSQANCLFGGMEDRTRLRAPGDTSPINTLTLTGMVTFGGVEIKN